MNLKHSDNNMTQNISRFRIAGLVLAIFIGVLASWARMTDDQVVAYIKQQVAAGKTEQQIGRELLARGVTQDQINRLKSQYDDGTYTAGDNSKSSSKTRVRGNSNTNSKNTNSKESGSDNTGTKSYVRTGNGAQVVNPMSQRRLQQQTDNDRATGTMTTQGQQVVNIDAQAVSATQQRDLVLFGDILPTTEKEQSVFYDENGEPVLFITREPQKKIFGHDIFNSEELSFEPNLNVATPKNYTLGPGDEVVIDIWGASEDHLREVISPEGYIMVEQIGPVYLSGLTIAEADRHVRNAFSEKYSGVEGEDASTDINLTLGDVRTIQVNVMGEVTIPGTYRLSPFATVFNALYSAGGVNDIGTLRGVQVLRNGQRLVNVDIYEYLFGGKQTGNIQLQEGDVLIVPPYEQLVEVVGNAKRPMLYETKSGETVLNLLDYAGGFAGDAYTGSVRLQRQTGTDNELFNVASGQFDTYVLKDGDIVTVGAVTERFSNRIELQGAVERPGIYALTDNVQTVSELIREAQGLTEDAFKSRAMIFREGPDLQLEVIPVDLAAILAGRATDIKLQRNDILEVPSVKEIEDRGPITINGLVAYPGEYPFAGNMDVADIVLQAGGLLRGASSARIEVSRRIYNPDETTPSSQIAEIFTFGIKDGKVVDGPSDFALQPYDIVEVRQSPVYNVQRRAEIQGEVAFEGGYTLQNKNERISELIKRAGGLTDEAYVRGAHLMRKMTDEELAQRDEILRLTMQSSGENDSISLAKLDLGDTYAVGINLEEALLNPESDYDLVIRDGDVLVVPELNNTVKIMGDVFFANTVVFKPGAKLDYYINQAGGYGESANKKKAFIVYLNGMVARADKKAKMEPGCTIIVPSKPKRGPFDWSKIVAMTTSLGTLGTMAAAVANMIRK